MSCSRDFDLYVGAVVPWTLEVKRPDAPSLAFDLTGYSLTLTIVKPSGAGVVASGLSPDAPATDGTVTYTPAIGFVDEPGDYLVYIDGDDGAGHVVPTCEAVIRVGQRRVPTP